MNQANPVRTDLAHLRTEARNPRTLHIDTLPTPDMVRLMCEENRVVEDAVAAQADAIAAAIDIIATRLDAGGHLIYVGAGTSGRLGVVDASECPPTFGVDDRLVRAVIAGGHEAMFHAIEGAEDSAERGAAELEADGVGAGDVVVGLVRLRRSTVCAGCPAPGTRAGRDTDGHHLQPGKPDAPPVRCHHGTLRRTGGHHRLLASQGRDSAEADPQYALHRSDDPHRQGCGQSDDKRPPHQRQTA